MAVVNLFEKIVSLCKRRGFVYPGSEIYGGLSNSWDYGPLGVELKNNLKNLWWQKFVRERTDVVGLDAALIMNPKVWQASGHLAEFTDPLIECKKCHSRFREDQLEVKVCPECKNKEFTQAKNFNLMFKTFIGPAEDQTSVAYFRPETAQSMFVDFKQVLNSTRLTLPFGIAQIGKAFRNEITPGNFIFRTREFEQMEIEYFFAPPKKDEQWQEHFDYWLKEMLAWIKDIGIDVDKIHLHEIEGSERAHYSKRTIDLEYEFPFGIKELYGLAYRTDFDLKNHQTASGVDLSYRDPHSGETSIPHVIEPTWGVDRTVFAVLLDAYREEGERVYLKLKPKLAPYKVAVFPLLKNKPELVDEAKKVFDLLKTKFTCSWDDRGNIGKRYFAQDEIGTPYCLTIDFDTLTDQSVTVRDRDTAKQERVKISELETFLQNKLN
jgi:glycyl-tRNA synthetase